MEVPDCTPASGRWSWDDNTYPGRNDIGFHGTVRLQCTGNVADPRRPLTIDDAYTGACTCPPGTAPMTPMTILSGPFSSRSDVGWRSVERAFGVRAPLPRSSRCAKRHPRDAVPV